MVKQENDFFNINTGEFQKEGTPFWPTPQPKQPQDHFQAFLPPSHFPKTFPNQENVSPISCKKHTNDLKTIVVYFKSWLQKNNRCRELRMFKSIKKLQNNSIKSMNRNAFKQLCQLPEMSELMIQSLLEFKPSPKLSLEKQAHYRSGALKILLRLLNGRLQSLQIQ